MRVLKGISFPFRIGVRGGVVMTKADLIDSTHISESIHQVLSTHLGERAMEAIGSNISSQIFEPNDSSTHTLIKYEIVEAISQHEKRVKVAMEDIELFSENEKVYATVNYKVLDSGVEDKMTAQIGG